MKKIFKTIQCVLNHLLINAFDTRPKKGQKYYITKQIKSFLLDSAVSGRDLEVNN